MRELLSNKKVMIGVIVGIIVLGYGFLRVSGYDSLPMDEYSEHIAKKVVGKENVDSSVFYEGDIFLNLVNESSKSNETTVEELEKKAVEILKKMKKKAEQEEFERFIIMFQRSPKDMDDKQQSKLIFIVKMTREKISEIDFADYALKNLKDDAYEYYAHSSIK